MSSLARVFRYRKTVESNNSEIGNAIDHRCRIWSGSMTAVTGATGFVGHACVAALSAAQVGIVCTVRERSNTRFLKALGSKVSLAQATLDDLRALTDAFAGCQTVVHYVI